MDAANGQNVDLPDPKSILPYVGLFTIVVLTPELLHGKFITTHYLPVLSISQGGDFVRAPPGTSPTDSNTARIFDVFSLIRMDTIHDPTTIFHGIIPLSPQFPQFQQQRYWRLPVNPGVILAGLMSRLVARCYDSEEIGLTQQI